MSTRSPFPPSGPHRRCKAALPRAVALLLMSLVATAGATPDAWVDACYVRPETVPASRPAASTPAAAQSVLGLRHSRTRLVDVALTVVGPNASACSITGVARLRSGADGEMLALPVRPDAGAARAAVAGPCLVFLRATPTAIELATTEASCQAQSLCGGQIQLQGQRFDRTNRMPLDAANPCFERPAARP
jgi:hypothetical protein